jgi:hypothetical protein
MLMNRVLLVLKIVDLVLHLLNFAEINNVIMEKTVHRVPLTVENVPFVVMVYVPIKVAKLVAIALKIAERVPFLNVAMETVIFTLMKTVQPVLMIVEYAH